MIRALVRGEPGNGKTWLAATFPQSYMIIGTPGEEDTWLYRPELKKNVVKSVVACPQDADDSKRAFQVLEDSIKEAKLLHTQGKVKTLVIDPITNIVENRWVYINRWGVKKTRQGEVDTRGMYGDLNRWCHDLVALKLLTFPGNLIVTVHEQVEEDEAMDKLPDKSSPISPAILGGFRYRIGAYFSLNMWMEKKLVGAGQYRYVAHLNKGMQRNAKSRYPLPDVIEDISYQKIMEYMEKAVKQPIGVPTTGGK